MIAGIWTSTLDSVKTRIMSDAFLHSDFDTCVNLYQDFIKQTTASQVKDVTVAALHSNKNGGGEEFAGDELHADMSIPLCYYDKAEYAKLTHAQKLGLHLKLMKHEGTNKSGKGKKSGKKKWTVDELQLSKHSIKALVSAVKEAETVASTDDGSADSDADAETVKAKGSKKQRNRDNKALIHKK